MPRMPKRSGRSCFSPRAESSAADHPTRGWRYLSVISDEHAVRFRKSDRGVVEKNNW